MAPLFSTVFYHARSHTIKIIYHTANPRLETGACTPNPTAPRPRWTPSRRSGPHVITPVAEAVVYNGSSPTETNVNAFVRVRRRGRIFGPNARARAFEDLRFSMEFPSVFLTSLTRSYFTPGIQKQTVKRALAVFRTSAAAPVMRHVTFLLPDTYFVFIRYYYYFFFFRYIPYGFFHFFLFPGVNAVINHHFGSITLKIQRR